ncbi:hypothetical protein CEXT_768251 [Caerostris extrusa]|uniref:Uncharacterized protein n=1 Tax=Caerostris extrusa TaxID=172846 RepID=A0AAV4QU36_CAEEX|nr:hypothetical protein CEXT_768251 [Caerostris extrusa]
MKECKDVFTRKNEKTYLHERTKRRTCMKERKDALTQNEQTYLQYISVEVVEGCESSSQTTPLNVLGSNCSGSKKPNLI